MVTNCYGITTLNLNALKQAKEESTGFDAQEKQVNSTRLFWIFLFLSSICAPASRYCSPLFVNSVRTWIAWRWMTSVAWFWCVLRVLESVMLCVMLCRNCDGKDIWFLKKLIHEAMKKGFFMVLGRRWIWFHKWRISVEVSFQKNESWNEVSFSLYSL